MSRDEDITPEEVRDLKPHEVAEKVPLQVATTLPAPEKERSYFVRLADRVSYGMGTPVNIGFWIVAVLVWFFLFGLHILGPDTNVLPAWFTSNAFNFPLNTVTTLAELYIGFLVGAAANRNERNSEEQSDRIESLERALGAELVKNTEETAAVRELTEKVHTLAEAVHQKVCVETPTRRPRKKATNVTKATKAT